jgi:hypothetical protein
MPPQPRCLPKTTHPENTTSTQPFAAAVFANGDVVVGWGPLPTAAVERFTAAGVLIGSLGSTWSTISGVTISPAGDVYVSEIVPQNSGSSGVYFFPGGSPTTCKPFVGDDPMISCSGNPPPPGSNPPGILWSTMSSNPPYNTGVPSNAWIVAYNDAPISPWVSANGDLFIGDNIRGTSRVLRNGTNGYDNYFTALVDAYDYSQPTTNFDFAATSVVTRFGC